MIGVIVLTFQSDDVIGACLDSLRASEEADLRIVVCDNASEDGTVETVRGWAAHHGIAVTEIDRPEEAGGDGITLIHTGGNLGYAGGVNVGLAHLMADPAIDLFWILNPDSEVRPGTAAAYARCAARAGRFALMGGRTLYHEAPRRIQSDGGRVSPWSGMCRNIGSGRMPDETPFPEAAEIDFISGANMVASRPFVERVGPMTEDYFLYYEEVDWAARRGDLPLVFCPEAVVEHHGGTAIGSRSVTRPASAFSNYFNYRNRMRYVRRFRPAMLPLAWALSMARVAKLAATGPRAEAWGAFAGLNGLPPPEGVRARIAPGDRARAFEARDRGR